MEEIDEYIVSENIEENKFYQNRGENFFLVSDALCCPRKLFYAKKISKDWPLETLKIFQVGNMIRRFYQKAISGLSNVEVAIGSQDIHIMGKVDKITVCGGVLMFKSVSNIQFNADKPSDYHVAQMNIFLKALNKKRGKIVYISKRNLKEVVHSVEYSEPLFSAIVRNFKIAYEDIRRNILPSRPGYDFQKFPCSYCLFRQECMEGKMPEGENKEEVESKEVEKKEEANVGDQEGDSTKEGDSEEAVAESEEKKKEVSEEEEGDKAPVEGEKKD